MTALWIILGIVCWTIAGYRAFVWWWTSEWDYTTEDRGAAWCAGIILGPLAYPVGWHIHRQSKPTTFSRPVGERSPLGGGRVIVQCRNAR